MSETIKTMNATMAVVLDTLGAMIERVENLENQVEALEFRVGDKQ